MSIRKALCPLKTQSESESRGFGVPDLELAM